jgi:DNA mismatch repair protein MutS2
VRLVSLGQTAEVITPPDADQKLTVRFGLLKTTVSLRDIESLQGEKAELPPKPPPAPPPSPAPSLAPVTVRTDRNTLDLRGMRVTEAEVALEAAIAQTQGCLWVIHGHGTGKLRQGVQDYLSRHPQVQRFTAADQSEGGTGVTLVYLT